jgi:hypothetical protein
MMSLHHCHRARPWLPPVVFGTGRVLIRSAGCGRDPPTRCLRRGSRLCRPLAGLFGFENGTTHRFTAEAVLDADVRLTRRRSLFDTMALREASPTNLLCLITRNLQHAENHMLLLGRKTALERGSSTHDCQACLIRPDATNPCLTVDYLRAKADKASPATSPVGTNRTCSGGLTMSAPEG